MKSTKAFVRPDHTAIISCPYCNCKKEIPVEKFKGNKFCLKIKCSCKEVYTLNLEFRKKVRKDVKLQGKFTNHSQKNIRGDLVVKNLSLGGLEFSTMEIDSFKNGDEVTVSFKLDNDNRTTIKKEVTVCSVRKQSYSVGCEFTRSSDIALDKDLGFYLMA
jgi:hypothetical protein